MNKTRSGPQPRVQLTEARNASGWSQNEVADKIGTTYVNVSRWERGITRPSPYFRKKLCVLFGKTEQELDLDLIPEGETLPETPESVAPQTSPPSSTPPTPPAAPSPDAIYDPAIPLPPTIHLVGRDDELGRLKERLRSGGSVALTALNGLPGVGKTALSITLAHEPELRTHFKDGIIWAGLGPEPNMQGHLSRWGTILGMSASEMSGLKDPDAWAVALHRAIGSRTMLLVIDDAWKLEEALTLKVGGPNCVHLVSTRFPSIATQIAPDGAIAIKELGIEEGMLLLRMLAPQVIEKEPERARELVLAVGGLPLALHLMGNYLRLQSYTGQARRISAALQKLTDANERLNVGEPRGPVERHPSLTNDTPVSLRTVIAVTDQYLDEQDKQASQTLYALSVFPPKPNSFSEEAALAIAACTVDTLDLLTDTGLLQSSGPDRYTLHQTIADYAHLQLKDHNPHERLITYITEFVETHRKEYEILEVESNNVLAALEAANKQAKHAELIRAACAFAPFLLARGLYQVAEIHLQRAYAAAQSCADQHGLASTLLYLGDMTWKQGNGEQAEKYLQEGLRYARKIDDHERICALLSSLGSVTWRRGEYKQAETYLQEGLVLAREFESLERICGLLDILGSVEMMQGNYLQSEEYLQEGLQLARQVGEKEVICRILLNLGGTAGEQGRYEKAEVYFQEGLKIARQINHREWISALLNNLGDVVEQQGNYTQAEQYFQEGLELARQIEHREWTSLLLHNLGLTTRKLGNYSLSEQYSQESLILAQQINIPQITCYILYEYGNLHIDQKKINQAKNNFDEMLATAPEGGQDLIALAQYGLARVLYIQKNIEEAIQMGKTSLAKLEAIGHRDTLEVRNWLHTLEKDNKKGGE
jgi:tetratricopeptide (TPR) repeat protein/transcriptional regulator with XRE-family HTH domain